MRAVLANAVRHLMPEHRGKLVHISIEPADQSAVDAHIVRRIAGSIEYGAVCHCPCKGQRVYAEDIVAVPHEPLHDGVDQRGVACIVRAPVLCDVLPLALHLRVHIIAEREHCAECGVICTEDTERLRCNPPRVNRLRTRGREKNSRCYGKRGKYRT